jgi:RNA polymerase sigma factor (sigma-70 family)
VNAPSERQEQLELLFLQHLSTIERIVAAFCRSYSLRGDDADDFASMVKLRLVENDYAVLAKFRGESTLPTYLTVVIATLLREYRVKQWGRWRPSAPAKRLGELAVRLETLVYRDGLPLAQAAQVLRSAGVTTMTDRELADLLKRLPVRTPLRPVQTDGGASQDVPAPGGADVVVTEAEAERARSSIERALATALERYSPEDRVIIHLRFWEGLSVADIARALKLDQKPLYRRVDRLLATLRLELERSGVSRDHVRSLLGEDAA